MKLFESRGVEQAAGSAGGAAAAADAAAAGGGASGSSQGPNSSSVKPSGSSSAATSAAATVRISMGPSAAAAATQGPHSSAGGKAGGTRSASTGGALESVVGAEGKDTRASLELLPSGQLVQRSAAAGGLKAPPQDEAPRGTPLPSAPVTAAGAPSKGSGSAATSSLQGVPVRRVLLFRGLRLRAGVDVGQLVAELQALTGRVNYHGRVSCGIV